MIFSHRHHYPILYFLTNQYYEKIDELTWYIYALISHTLSIGYHISISDYCSLSATAQLKRYVICIANSAFSFI